MRTDITIQEIRRIRQQISSEFDHDVRKLGEHYQRLQKQYPRKMAARHFPGSDIQEYRIPVSDAATTGVAEKRRKYR